jgi:hypothetical protein
MVAVPELSRIDRLKASLRQIAPTALFDPSLEEGGLATGFPDLDGRLAAAGFPAGRITEIAGAPSSGKATVALSAIARCPALAAFIDGQGQLFPPAAAALGVDLERLLIVRPPLEAAPRAAEILIRSRGFALIVIDLPGGARLDRHRAHRLRTAAHQRGAALLVLCNRVGDVDGAHTRIQLVAGPRDPAAGAPAIQALIHRGSRSGGLESIDLTPPTFRIDSEGAAPIAPAIERRSPGLEPNPRSARAQRRGAV